MSDKKGGATHARHGGKGHKQPIVITINNPKPKEKKEPEPHPFIGQWNDAGHPSHPYNAMRSTYSWAKKLGMKHTGSQGTWHGFRSKNHSAWIGDEGFVHTGPDGMTRVGRRENLEKFMGAMVKRHGKMKTFEAREQDPVITLHEQGIVTSVPTGRLPLALISIQELGAIAQAYFTPRNPGQRVYHTRSHKVGVVTHKSDKGDHHVQWSDGSASVHNHYELGLVMN